ncbi:HAD family hydrolase [Treponema sp.]|uniref:HAD family hydrolase n=1 Tax=Treponema sp. TaxID=166 RepID=UPI003F0B1C94
MEISGAIFDLDGTLVDSMPLYGKIGRQYLKKIGLQDKKELEKLFFTHTSVEIADYLTQVLHLAQDKKQIVQTLNQCFLDCYRNQVEAKKGAVFFLRLLKSRGIPTALLTASDRPLAIPCLRRTGLFPLIDELVFCSEHNASKRNPEIFFYTAQKINAAPETTYVFEDALYSASTAKKAGFKVCALYDAWCSHDWDELKNISDISGIDFDEVYAKFLMQNSGK